MARAAAAVEFARTSALQQLVTLWVKFMSTSATDASAKEVLHHEPNALKVVVQVLSISTCTAGLSTFGLWCNKS